jgi:hypothetical protein
MFVAVRNSHKTQSQGQELSEGRKSEVTVSVKISSTLSSPFRNLRNLGWVLSFPQDMELWYEPMIAGT